MSLNIASAASFSDLLATLQAISISVPKRIEGRTTDHTETWVGARLLATLAGQRRIALPLAVTHRDRPDLYFRSGTDDIGIEITEAISEQFAAYCALAEREFPGVFLDPGHFRWGAPRMTVKEMRELLGQSQLTSDGWAGDRPEQEWALFIQSVVDAKQAKLAHKDFAKFGQNWLAIYDNLPLPSVHLAKAISFLRPLLQDRWVSDPSFDVLYVERGPVIARITEAGSEHFVLKDLWS